MASGLADQHRVQADLALVALEFGLISPGQVVVWGDSLIAASQEPPPPWMMDLALVCTDDWLAVQSALRTVPGHHDRGATMDLLGALTLREWGKGRLTIGEVRGIGWKTYRREYEAGDARHWGVAVECAGDDYDGELISEGTLRDFIDEQLAQYAPRIPELPSWM